MFADDIDRRPGQSNRSEDGVVGSNDGCADALPSWTVLSIIEGDALILNRFEFGYELVTLYDRRLRVPRKIMCVDYLFDPLLTEQREDSLPADGTVDIVSRPRFRRKLDVHALGRAVEVHSPSPLFDGEIRDKSGITNERVTRMDEQSRLIALYCHLSVTAVRRNCDHLQPGERL